MLKNIRQKLREKLELDNSEKYLDGYYQLSKKQKWCWVLGLFVIGVIFAIARYLIMGANSSGVVIFVPIILTSVFLLLISFIPAFLWHWIDGKARKSMGLGGNIENKTRRIVMYQLWSIFLLAIIFAIILKIPLKAILPFFPNL